MEELASRIAGALRTEFAFVMGFGMAADDDAWFKAGLAITEATLEPHPTFNDLFRLKKETASVG